MARRQLGAQRVVDAHDLRSGDLAEVAVEAVDDGRRTSRSARGSRARRWCRIVACSGSSRWVASLSSASTTSHSPPVQWAPVPASVTSPPTMKLGASPASARISISIDVVVVLPWVPATATARAWAQIAASIPARRSVGMPCSAGRPQLDVAVGDRRRRRDGVAADDDGRVVADVDRRRRPPGPGRAPAARAGRCRTRRGPSRRGRWRWRSSPVRRRRRRAGAAGARQVERRDAAQRSRRGAADHGASRLGAGGTARPATRRRGLLDDVDERPAAVQRAGGGGPLAELGQPDRVGPQPVDQRRRARRARPRRAGSAAPWSDSQRTFSVWWSSAAPDHGTRIAGVPVTATSATVLAPPRPDEQVGGGVEQLDAVVVADDLVQRRRRCRRAAAGAAARNRSPTTWRTARPVSSCVAVDERGHGLVERRRALRAAGDGDDEAVGGQVQLARGRRRGRGRGRRRGSAGAPARR